MSKPTLYVQERMDEALVPLPKKREVFNSFADMFESEFVEDEWKLRWISQVQGFPTLNGVTKHDLQAALKWLFNQHYVITKE